MKKTVKHVDPYNENKQLEVEVIDIFKDHIIININGQATKFKYHFKDAELVIYL